MRRGALRSADAARESLAAARGALAVRGAAVRGSLLVLAFAAAAAVLALAGDALADAGGPPAPAGGDQLPPSRLLGELAPFAALFAEGAYLLLSLVGALAFARRRPREALVLLLLLAVALALRFGGAPRVPIVAATADATVVGGASWAQDWGWSWMPGGNPPAPGVFFAIVLRVFPSLDATFAAVTIVGALMLVPVYFVAARAARAPAAGMLAAVAQAALPYSVIFSNGANAETLGAFLAIASFQHLLAWLDEDRTIDALRYLLCLVLFVQTRQEGPLHVFLLLAAHLVIVVHSGRLRTLFRPWPFSAALLAGGVVLLLPFGVLMLEHILTPQSPNLGGVIRHSLELLAFMLPTLVLSGLVWGRVAPRFGDDPILSRRGLAALILVTALVILNGLHRFEIPGLLSPAWLAEPAVDPFHRSINYAPINAVTPLEHPYFVPLPLFGCWLLSMLPPLAAARDRVSAVLPLVCLVLAWCFMCFRVVGSGELIGDGLRHALNAVGFLAVSCGLGVYALVSLLGRFASHAAPLAAGTALLASPMVTHSAVMRDVDFDDQRQFRFLIPSLAKLPPGAQVVVPDHVILGEGGNGTTIVHTASRTDGLFMALASLHAVARPALPFSEWARGGFDFRHPIVFYRNVDCYRTDRPSEHPLCVAVPTLPGSRTLAETHFTSRPYTRYPRLHVRELSLSLVELSPEARGRLAALNELTERLNLPRPP